MKSIFGTGRLVLKWMVFFFCVFGLPACAGSSVSGEQSGDGEDFYKIDLDQVAGQKESMLYSSLFGSVKTILLDTARQALVSDIGKIDVYKDELFVLDMRLPKVLVFDFDGAFVRRIGRQGSGPGEYLDPADFTIDRNNGIIYVLDGQKQRVNAYTVESGDFLRSVDIDRQSAAWCHHIQYVNGLLFADAYFSAPAPENYLLQQIDLASGKQQATFLNVDEYNKGWNDLGLIDHPVFCNLGADSALFMHRFMDHVILLDGQAVKPYLVLQGSDLMNAEGVKTLNQNVDFLDVFLKLRELRRIYELNFCTRHGDTVFAGCSKGIERLSLLYDTKDGRTKSVDWRDDLLFDPRSKMGGLIPSFGCATSEGWFYFINPGKLASFKGLKDDTGSGRLSPGLDRFDQLKNMDDNENPIVFFYKYK